MVGNRAEDEDLAQETFLAAFKSLVTFRADSKFSTWLYRIATNKCKDWLRVKRPGQGLHDVDVDEVLDAHVAEDRTPERLLSQRRVHWNSNRRSSGCRRSIARPLCSSISKD
jgi:RNA polymerase sigma-70 factor, ECF subfamily